MPIGAVVGASVVGAGASIIGSSNAAGAQKDAVNSANATQTAMYNQTRSDLAPFVQAGTGALGQLQQLTGTNEGGNPLTAPLTAQFQPTMEQLEATPGYKFSLDQLMKSTQNSYAAKGLGSSGAAIKGAQDRTLGLASTTYQQNLDDYLKQNLQTYNMLTGQATLGANAAAGQATAGSNTANQISSNTIGAGNAQAASYMTGANAITGAASNVSNTYLQQQMLSQLLARGGSPGTVNPVSGGPIGTFPDGGGSAPMWT